jgi:hypothetical protein
MQLISMVVSTLSKRRPLSLQYLSAWILENCEHRMINNGYGNTISLGFTHKFIYKFQTSRKQCMRKNWFYLVESFQDNEIYIYRCHDSRVLL